MNKKSKGISYFYNEYKSVVSDLANNSIVRSMEAYTQHSDISCYLHSLNVSYHSYLVCKFLGFDYEAAARGGILHDLFLYDWHTTKPENGMHGFTHPYAALENSNKNFELSDIEKDIIVKHMWPLTIKFPKYKEAYVVSFVDKYCTVLEVIRKYNRKKLCIIDNFLTQEK